MYQDGKVDMRAFGQAVKETREKRGMPQEKRQNINEVIFFRQGDDCGIGLR